MFTGIIQNTSTILSASKQGSILVVRVAMPRAWKLKRGQSVSVDGICSTVVKRSAKFFEVQYMPETLLKTTAGSLIKGTVVNLERSLTLQSFIDGHIVQGHVDMRGMVSEITKDGETQNITIVVPDDLRKFIVSKGSIAMNGVSLTVARVEGVSVTVALIPYTIAHTNLGLLKPKDVVNVEVDLLARYSLNYAKKK